MDRKEITKILVLKGIYCLTRDGLPRDRARLGLIAQVDEARLDEVLRELARHGWLDQRGNLTFHGLAIAVALKAPGRTRGHVLAHAA